MPAKNIGPFPLELSTTTTVTTSHTIRLTPDEMQMVLREWARDVYPVFNLQRPHDIGVEFADYPGVTTITCCTETIEEVPT